MPKSKKKNMAEMGWRAEQMRITLFPRTSPLKLNLKALCGEIYGEKPEMYAEGPAVHNAQYPIGKNRILVISSLVDRIHILLAARSDDSQPKIGMTDMGLHNDVLTDFKESSDPWLHSEALGDIWRVAFGCIILSPTDSRIDGYTQLAKLLPSVDLDINHSRNFLYQINRPRNYKYDDTEILINRLTKWSVLDMKSVAFYLTGADEAQVQQSASKFACRLELDVSTDENIKENSIPNDQIPLLMGEMMALGLEVAQKGDIV